MKAVIEFENVDVEYPCKQITGDSYFIGTRSHNVHESICLYMISGGIADIFEKAKSFFPKSFSEAPIW